MTTHLDPALTESILTKLGIPNRPNPDLPGLEVIYRNWCERVPFDNFQKRIFLGSGNGANPPAIDTHLFFRDWLAHGTGGLCWDQTAALSSLLTTLGFSVGGGLGLMGGPKEKVHNHATLFAKIDGERYLVDGSFQFRKPLLWKTSTHAGDSHPAERARLEPNGDHWVLYWHPLHFSKEFSCREIYFEDSPQLFEELHQKSYARSLFNFGLYSRKLTSDGIIGTAFGSKVTVDSTKKRARTQMNEKERKDFLISAMGYSEEIVSKLPPDDPLPLPLRLVLWLAS